MKDQTILRVISKWTIPFIILFGFYIITHGEGGPGGGFQGGVVVAAGFILYGLVYSGKEMRRILPRGVTDAASCLGVLLYAGVGVYCMVRGYKFLDYTALIPGDPGGAEPWGMTFVEYAVGLTVAAVMITIFNEITEGTDPEPAGEEPKPEQDVPDEASSGSEQPGTPTEHESETEFSPGVETGPIDQGEAAPSLALRAPNGVGLDAGETKAESEEE